MLLFLCKDIDMFVSRPTTRYTFCIMDGCFPSLFILVVLFSHIIIWAFFLTKYIFLLSLLIPWVHKGMHASVALCKDLICTELLIFLNWTFPEFGCRKRQPEYHPAWLGSNKDGAACWGHVEEAVEEMMWTTRLLRHITASCNFCCSLLVGQKVCTFLTVLFMNMTGSTMLPSEAGLLGHV
jgi:hypothetical protein